MTALRRDPWTVPTAVVVGALLGLVAARSPRMAALVIFAAVGFVLILTRPEFVLLAMIMALPWENKLHYPSASLSTVKGIGAALTLAYVLRLCSQKRTRVYLPPLLGIVAALGIWIGISLVVSADPSEGTQKLIRWALFLVFFFLVVQLVDGRHAIRRVLRCFTASVAAASIYALWLFVGSHNGYRASGPLEDPNDFGYLLACTAPLAAYLVTADRRRRPLWGLCFALIVAGMLATFSRGALVGIGALLLWGIVTRRIPLWAMLSGIVVASVVTALAFTLWAPLLDTALHEKEHIASANTESREALWVAALKLAERRPLTGVGPERFPKEALPLLRNDPINLARANVKRSVTHNSYLEILSEDGIPALLLFLAYLAVAWRLTRVAQRRAICNNDADERRLATALQASLLIAIVSGVFLSEELSAPFWLLGGLAVALARDGVIPLRVRPKRRSVVAPRLEPTLA